MKGTFGLPRYIWLILAGLFMALVLYSSTQPTPQVSGISQSFVDHMLNYAHIPIYSVLTFLLLFSFCSFDFRRQIAAFVVAVLFGILNEWVQQYIPGRSCSVDDVLNNALGALLAIVIAQVFYKKSIETLV
ncbi:MAG: VanZ family protein [Candidatus Omnitrophica bacterium]|nr:VanZ family protein [Candidatus Omnitrophota bacterium]